MHETFAKMQKQLGISTAITMLQWHMCDKKTTQSTQSITNHAKGFGAIQSYKIPIIEQLSNHIIEGWNTNQLLREILYWQSLKSQKA